MNRVRWSLTIPESTDIALRTYLAGTGMKKGDISQFVDQAVQRQLADLITDKVKNRNQQFDQNHILSSIDEALSNRSFQ
ncbi:MAG: hypothetical protein EBR59_10735 [Methylococcaceae bacterium]|jgi:hypothetical protein|nr:hypothetical protein [Methylococcaceae bacterium]